MNNLENFLDTVVWGLILSEEYKNRGDIGPVIANKIETGRKNLRQIVNLLETDHQIVDEVFEFIFNHWNDKPVQEISKTISIFGYLDNEKASPYIIEKLHLLANTPGEASDIFAASYTSPSQQTTGGGFVNTAAVKCISHFYNSVSNKNLAQSYLLELLENTKPGVAQKTLIGMAGIQEASSVLLNKVLAIASDSDATLERGRAIELLGIWESKSRNN